VKTAVKRVAEPLDRLRVRRWRRRTGYAGPIPPLGLRTRVGAGLSIGHFVEGGEQTARALDAVFSRYERPLQPARRILDFGCGCARTVPHVRGLAGPGPAIVGCDVDPAAIRWAQRAFPSERFVVNDFRPPLDFEDGSFDRIYSVSIFTHLSEQEQDAWLRELDRLLSPDGLGVYTVHGPAAYGTYRSGVVASRDRAFTRELRNLPPLGLERPVFVSYPVTTDFPGVGDAYGLAFHHPDYVAEHWPALVDVVDQLPAGNGGEHDKVVVRKRSQDPRDLSGIKPRARPDR
jgi:SAM-dependent methyltransferase